MKRLLTLAGLLLSLSVTAQYNISLSIPQFDTGTAYLTYHYGKNLMIADSGAVSPKGLVVFKGNESLPSGIYSVVLPGKRILSDFFVDKEQNIQISMPDTLKFMEMVVKGSPENNLFKEYQKKTTSLGMQLQAARKNYTTAKNAQDSAKYEKEFTQLNSELVAYRKSIIDQQPESMLAAVLSAMQEPEILHKEPKTRQDSLDNYYHYKAHYWDGITFMDERILRTPFFIPKFERYYREIIHQSPDSIIKDIDYKLLLARNAPELFKYMLNWLTDEYINPKYMGQDAVFVHLFNKYHSKGLSPWLNEKQMETITRRAYMQMSNLIGEKAANLNLLDTNNKPRPLYDVKASYTIVVFWDPSCGHCKKEVPKLDSIYRANWKDKDVKIYAVLSEFNKTEWVNFVKKHDLKEWIHVHQTKEMADDDIAKKQPSYKQLYDVVQTPTIYLLDKEKRIIGKKLTLEQINDLLEVKWQTDQK
jgi:thiol-disulfide isomerase/thioredoxin